MKKQIILAVFALLLPAAAFSQRAVIPAHGPYTYIAPTISPDGKYLAFIRLKENEAWARSETAVCFIHVKNIDEANPFDGGTEELYGSSIMIPQRIVGWLSKPDSNVGIAYFVGGNSKKYTEMLLMQQIADGVPSRLIMPEFDNFQRVAFSPSIKQIVASVSVGDQLNRLLLLRNGKQTKVADGGYFSGVTWTPDESAIIFSVSGLLKDGKYLNHTYQLFRYEIATDKLTKITPDDKTMEQAPVLMPDKQHLLFLAGDNQLQLGVFARNGLNKWMSKYNVCITPLATYAPRIITTGMHPIVSPDGKKLFVYQYRDADPKEHLFGNCVGVITDIMGKELKTIDFGSEVLYTEEGFTFADDSNHFIYARNGSLWLDKLEDVVVSVQ